MHSGGDLSVCWGTCHVLWGLCYVTAGAVQLVAGLFALLSLPVLTLGSNVWTGAWNILGGITGALLAGLVTRIRPAHQEFLLYLSLSVLGVNTANLVLLEGGEWWILMSDAMREEVSQRGLSRLVHYARLSTSCSTALTIVIALFDVHLSFCLLQIRRDRRRRMQRAPDPMTDIEYVMPRKKMSESEDEEEHGTGLGSRSHKHNAQSWVFDTGPNVTDERDDPLDANSLAGDGNESASETVKTYLLTVSQKPPPPAIVVKVEPAPVEDRCLNHMTSFSRTPSPTFSLNHPLYESVNDFPSRSRLYTSGSLYRQGRGDSRPGSRTHRRCESDVTVIVDNRALSATSLHNVNRVPEKIQYASLMLELEQAIQMKRGAPYADKSPLSNTSSDRSPHKDSDTEFSKELEAALQLLQDLGSPLTIDTPSESCTKQLNVSGSGAQSTQGKCVPSVTMNLSDAPLDEAVDSSGYSSPIRDLNSTCGATVSATTSEDQEAIRRCHTPPATITFGHKRSLMKPWKYRTVTMNADVIYESESLVCLSELELLARYYRTKAEQRVRRKTHAET